MNTFFKDRNGNLSVIFAISLVPLLGSIGLAVDYARAVNVRSYVQAEADAAALSGAQLGPAGNPKMYLDHLRHVTEQRFGAGQWIDAMKIESKWLSEVDFEVTARGSVPITFFAAVPGMPKSVDIGVRSTVRIAEPREVYKPPVISELDNEAGDYNRVYVYCFDPTLVKGQGKGDGTRKTARLQMTAIADNAGTKYSYTMPRCAEGQQLSYKLLNVRMARLDPKKWDDPKGQKFEYHTDTTLKNGTYDYHLDGKDVLETVLCDSLAECKPKSKGGIIPEGKNRDPVTATELCSKGKYMYYGWEDRPPGQKGPAKDWTDVAWTDSDYDDIRIVMECPTLELQHERRVRLTS